MLDQEATFRAENRQGYNIDHPQFPCLFIKGWPLRMNERPGRLVRMIDHAVDQSIVPIGGSRIPWVTIGWYMTLQKQFDANTHYHRTKSKKIEGFDRIHTCGLGQKKLPSVRRAHLEKFNKFR